AYAIKKPIKETAMTVIASLGFLLTLMLNEVESWILPWKQER
ncbi:MAG: hypothetical protein JWM42_190, partial [Burkholderia sp.]|nr:hypothetical protein [Burkholderia sp.]